MTAVSVSGSTRVVFVLVPGFHLLELAGPAQVFSTAADLGYSYTLAYVGEQEEVRSAQGVAMRTERDWPDLDADDLVVLPGWRSPALARRPPLGSDTGERLTAHHRQGGTVVSICAGAAALGHLGLLDGRRFTTHHELADKVAERHPAATLVRGVLYVCDDRVITSAGIASGIDLALHLVANTHGALAAAQVAREMVVYARRNGDEPQASAMLRHRSHLSELAHQVQDLIDARYAEPLTRSELAGSVGVSDRTLSRIFVRATGLTPLRYQQELRLERAQHLIDQGDTVEAAARTVGFEDARMLRRLRSRAA